MFAEQLTFARAQVFMCMYDACMSNYVCEYVCTSIYVCEYVCEYVCV